MKKQLLRVKQIADQTFLRAEKTEVLTEDLVNAEKKVEIIKQSFQASYKKIASCHIDFGSEISVEKRLKKIPQIALATSMYENGNNFCKSSILGSTLKECSTAQTKLGNELLDFINEVEKSILKPIGNVLENEIHSISKLRKQLVKLTLDMDSARSRFLAAERHSIQASSTVNVNNVPTKIDKIDTLKDELEEASQKVDQCRDTLAAEMFSLIAKEPYLAQIFIHLHQLQANYHRSALAVLETTLPVLEKELSNFPQKPVYGCSLEEHLRVTNRQVAHVIETCVYFLLEYGIMEEGLLRIAGSASKLKKLKSAFDAGLDIDMTEYVRDPHAVSGALKSYLRELPEPLMTFALYEEWMAAARIPDLDARLHALWVVLHKLPEANFINLQYVMKFLSKLHEQSEVNKMSSQNIAIVMAPNLIWSPVEDISFGLNMSTANLHGTIIDMLITYCSWFFPDAEFPICKVQQLPQQSNNDSEAINVKTKDDSNSAYLSAGAAHDTSACSPRTAQRLNKKPAAPPPPARNLVTSDLSEENTENVNVADLMDLSELPMPTVSNTINVIADVCLRPKSSENQNILYKDVVPSPRTSVIRRRSNENISSLSSTKGEKPNVPEKPPSYSTYSLDRKLQKPFIPKPLGSEKAEYIPRTQRPTVPPPERPAKPSRFSTIEMLSSDVLKLNQNPLLDEETIIIETKSDEASDSNSSDHLTSTDSELNNSCDLTKLQSSPKSQPTAKSQSKQNRFEFLVAQTVDKPPERPPRTVLTGQDVSDRIDLPDEALNSSNKETEEKLPSALTSPKIASDEEESASTSVLMKLSNVDKPKPPRPQPPIPFAKPKINENTNL